ncbi:hypothetical protein JCM10212_006622 [Sporobolomyces blumeae]
MQAYLPYAMDGEQDSPGLPGGQLAKYQGAWFGTQLTLSLAIGVFAFLAFSTLRRLERFQVLYKPRTLLKGFSPHEVHDHESFFGWVLPTLRTSEFVVLQLVGLDAAVLLSFLRTGFYFFLTCTVVAFTVLVPINYRENGTLEGVPPQQNSTRSDALVADLAPLAAPRQNHGSTLYLTSHLCFTYLFTILALVYLHRNWRRYIPLRQLFSLELAHSIPARTVMITDLPPHLRSERALADYFEGIRLGEDNGQASSGLAVESVVVSRAIGSMRELLERRTRALRTLEEAWAKYLGNPVPVEGKSAVFGYDRDVEVERILTGQAATDGDEEQVVGNGESTALAEGRLVDVDGLEPSGDGEGAAGTDGDGGFEASLPSSPPKPNIVSSKKRPTLRPHWFAKKVDALDYYAEQFRKADEAVRKRRRGKFRPTGTAFVTFQSLAAAQVAAQTVHYPSATEFRTELAPEPRDINWGNLNMSKTSAFIRRVLVVIIMLVLLSVWAIPVAALASLLSWDTIKQTAPRLAKLLGKSPRLRGLVQTTLPSLALVLFNNLLPFLLEALSVFQGLEARSWIELSQLKKYHISLVLTTLFVFISASTYQLLQDISQSPAKVLDKLANTLPKTRNFMVAYVMLSGLGLLPLQLLELGTVIPRGFYQLFLTRTPRDHAELNAPSMVNLGVVYPQALLIWTLGLTYSVIMPVILPFTTVYFGLAYLVYKYRFLFVYYRPYESRGQAWPIAFNRVGLALVIFQVFMLGLFTVRKAFLLSALMVPLSLSTLYTLYYLSSTYSPLSKFINLSQAAEVTHGATAGDVVQLRQGHPVTTSQTNLNRGRYAHQGEGIYAVAKNAATDYSQPPLSDSYPGVLQTASNRRYGHPALFGALPEPWLPVQAEPSDRHIGEVPQAVRDALVVIDLGQRWRNFKRAARRGVNGIVGNDDTDVGNESIARGERSRGKRVRRGWSRSSNTSEEDPSRAWRGSEEPESPGRSLGAQSDDEDEEHDEDGQVSRYSTFYPHRQTQRFPPRALGESSDTEDEA